MEIKQGVQKGIEIRNKVKRSRDNYLRTGYDSKSYYKQFNNREEEITRNKRSVAVLEGEESGNTQRSNIRQLLDHLDNLHDQEWTGEEIEENLIVIKQYALIKLEEFTEKMKNKKENGERYMEENEANAN